MPEHPTAWDPFDLARQDEVFSTRDEPTYDLLARGNPALPTDTAAFSSSHSAGVLFPHPGQDGRGAGPHFPRADHPRGL